ncbi:MAG: UDP-4-amino-4,6-dideoxy-N-acetyl-beta-L-altrosamine transaminase [Bacteroidota bacterium]
MITLPKPTAIPYGRQHITDEDIRAVVDTLKGDWLTQGPAVRQFEEAFAKYVDAPYAVAVNNGTAALHLAAMALGADHNSKVITTPITFAASANAMRYCGSQVEFADIDPATALIDIQSVWKKLQSAEKGTYAGMVLVDFAGRAVDLEAFRKLADEFGMWIIEDACHAPGGHFIDSLDRPQKCGNGRFADLSTFSFHPVKHIACGEGGMITTRSRELYEKLLVLRTHGITKAPEKLHENHGGWYYEMQQLGYNYRLTDIQCVLGLSQLSRAEEGLAKRRAIALRYDEAFRDSDLQPLYTADAPGHAFHLYVIQCRERKELYQWLRAAGIYTQVHYIPLHQMPYYQSQNRTDEKYPHAEAYYDQCLSLPMYPSLTEDEQAYVIQKIKEFESRPS